MSTYQRDQVRPVDRPPAVLGGLQQLERHRQPRSFGAGTLGDAGSEPHRREGRLDRVAGLEVLPMLGRVIEEAQQLLGVIGDLGHRLGPLDAGARFDKGVMVERPEQVQEVAA